MVQWECKDLAGLFLNRVFFVCSYKRRRDFNQQKLWTNWLNSCILFVFNYFLELTNLKCRHFGYDPPFFSIINGYAVIRSLLLGAFCASSPNIKRRWHKAPAAKAFHHLPPPPACLGHREIPSLSHDHVNCRAEREKTPAPQSEISSKSSSWKSSTANLESAAGEGRLSSDLFVRSSMPSYAIYQTHLSRQAIWRFPELGVPQNRCFTMLFKGKWHF